MTIGELAAGTGLSVPTIRYYESIGMIPRAARGDGGQRRYGSEDLTRLGFIRSRRALGFPLAEIRDLMRRAGPDAAPCADARAAAITQLRRLRAELAALHLAETELLLQIAACDSGCGPADDTACLLIPGRI